MIGAKWGVRENELGNKHPATKKEGGGENKCWQETFHLSSDKLETGGLFLSYTEWQVNVTPPVGMTVKTNKKRTPVVFTQNHHDTGKSAEKSETWTKKKLKLW